jgi:hypothetical protein
MKLNDARHAGQHAHNGERGGGEPREATRVLSIRCVRCASVDLCAGRPATRPRGPRPGATGPTPTPANLFRRNYIRVRMPTASRRINTSGPSAREARDSSTCRGPGGPLTGERTFQPRAKHMNVTSRVASQRSFLARDYPIPQNNLWTSCGLRPSLSRPILFVKVPIFATERSNTPGDRVLTGCRPVASWAKLVRGREGHR